MHELGEEHGGERRKFGRFEHASAASQQGGNHLQGDLDLVVNNRETLWLNEAA
jgi:hypothetical protein